MRDEDILRAFYSNKDSNIVNYNFDLKELVDNFSLLNFIKNGRKVCSSDLGDDFGGFFVCTPKQYIIGYNSNFGSGAHITAFGRVMKDIMGGGEITSIDELTQMGTICTDKYICGRIVYENVGDNIYGRPILKGYISFLIKNNSSHISNKMFESFKKFYDDYNDEVSLACKNSNGSFYVSYFDKDNKKRVQSSSLDAVYQYLEKHIDNNLNDEDNEEIIGVLTEEKALN